MDYLQTIITMITLCEKAVMTARTIFPILKGGFTPEEREILAAVADDGLIQLVQVNGGLVLYCGGRQWDSTEAPAEAARHLDAFERLCWRGLIRHVQANIFTLTGQGFRLAQLAKSGQPLCWRDRLGRWLRWLGHP